MAIARDSSSVNTSGSNFSFTNTAGNFLLVCVRGDLASDNVSAVTYNGVSMTQVAKVIDATDRSIYMYRLASPATGSNTVAITASGGGWVVAHCISYSGVDTASPMAATAQTKDEASVSSQSISVTTTVDNAWLVGFFATNTDKTYTPDSGTTTVQSGGSVSTASCDSNGAKTPTGSYALGYGYGSAAAFAEGIVSAIAPGAEVTGGGFIYMSV